MLSAIYEADFLGFSYGFRPGRNPHQALTSLHMAIMSQRVNWVLDADIRSFFDSVDHEWLLRMVAHLVAEPTLDAIAGRLDKAEAFKADAINWIAQACQPEPLLQRVPADDWKEVWSSDAGLLLQPAS